MPKIVNHDQRREELLNASFALFAQRGYAAVTMRELAKELSVSTGLLYYYFPNKESLFEQMFALMSQRDVLRVTAELDPTSDISTKLTILFKYLSKNEDHFQNLILMALDFRRHQRCEASSQALPDIVKTYSQAIEDRLNLKGTGIGSILFSFLCGMFIQRLLAPRAASIQRHSHLLTTMLEAFDPAALLQSKTKATPTSPKQP